jgi:hypothetical protein
MSYRFLPCSAIAAAVLFLASHAAGQGVVMDKSAAAKAPDAANKPTPRTADGHPDMNGVWHHYFLQGEYKPLKPGESATFNFSIAGPGVKDLATQGTLPEYKPELVAKVKDLDEHQNQTDPTLTCVPPGVPRLGPPNQIVQSPNQVVFLYTDLTGEFFRVIPTDNRAHRADLEGSYNGDSVGHWEGDTLVVDANNFVDDTWLGDNGLMHSDKLHVVERLRRKGDTVDYEVTVEDPAVLAKPWIMSPRTLILQPDILEQAPPCIDKDVPHLTDLSHHGNNR